MIHQLKFNISRHAQNVSFKKWDVTAGDSAGTETGIKPFRNDCAAQQPAATALRAAIADVFIIKTKIIP
ncbi:MAG: hypothetical protein WC959_09205 [Kiritimatiellales bacterium]